MMNLSSPSLDVSWLQRLGHRPRGEPGYVGENLRSEGDGEHDHRGVHLRDALQGLQIPDIHKPFIKFLSHINLPELHCEGVLCQHLCRVLQSPAGLVLPLGGDHLPPGVPGGLGLGCHGGHQLLGHPDILDLDPLHGDAPVLGALHQQLVYLGGDLHPVTEDLTQAAGAQHVPRIGG